VTSNLIKSGSYGTSGDVLIGGTLLLLFSKYNLYVTEPLILATVAVKDPFTKPQVVGVTLVIDTQLDAEETYMLSVVLLFCVNSVGPPQESFISSTYKPAGRLLYVLNPLKISVSTEGPPPALGDQGFGRYQVILIGSDVVDRLRVNDPDPLF
jgi:hypothetical protein